jgi:chaperonin GroES
MRVYLEPLQAMLYIVPDAPDAMTPAGLHIPEQARRQSPLVTGTVVSVGPDCKSVKPGEHVLFVLHLGTAVTIGEITALLVEEKNCLGVVREVPDSAIVVEDVEAETLQIPRTAEGA